MTTEQIFPNRTETNGILIETACELLEKGSDPAHRVWMFAYTVRITNRRTEAAKLVSRRWLINDAWGRTREVQGFGVVGVQPRILPGNSFEYSSVCPLQTPFGTMQGAYHMVTDDGENFHAHINEFVLSEPEQIH